MAVCLFREQYCRILQRHTVLLALHVVAAVLYLTRPLDFTTYLLIMQILDIHMCKLPEGICLGTFTSILEQSVIFGQGYFNLMHHILSWFWL